MINFLRRIGQEHLHDRMTQEQNADAHNKIERFCLDQTSPHTLTYTVTFARTEILGNIVGNSSHHGIIHKN